ncbi:MAG: hypothetical protein K2K49_03045, partial [Duncaniella sp.]|nr:hypothetical protein [Duncaniella sp.]
MNNIQNTPPPYNAGGRSYGYDNGSSVQTVSSVMRLVYVKMTLALLVTAFVSLFCSSSMGYMRFMAMNSWFYWGLFIAELAIVFVMSARLTRMSSLSATLLFYVFAILNG